MKSTAVRLKCTAEGSLLGTPKAKAGLSPGSNQVVYYMQSNFRIPVFRIPGYWGIRIFGQNNNYMMFLRVR